MLAAREVPLGGLRAAMVRRTLPHKTRPTIGAWCFLDRFHMTAGEAMEVAPHPHIGLQTVTWPLSGLVRHRDSVGSDVVLRPGELNLMTAGRGIAHSEYSLEAGGDLLDGVQLWVALPDDARHAEPMFEHHDSLPVVELPAAAGPSAQATVFMGALAGVSSPATTFTPLVGAFLVLPPGSRVRVPVEPDWEHAVVTLHGEARLVAPVEMGLPRDDLACLAPGVDHIDLASADGAQVLLIGGEPFRESLVMWWNFVGRGHEEIAQAREDWEAQASRFGTVEGHGYLRIPAPPLPTVRLKPRKPR